MSEHVAGDAVPEVDESRRKFLIAATVGTGAVGAVFAAVPFIASWSPSERARAAGPGRSRSLQDRARPDGGHVSQEGHVHRASHAGDGGAGAARRQAEGSGSEDSEQPEYARNAARAVRDDFLVVEGTCTHLGCLPKARFEKGMPELGADWPGGFFCPCHGSRFDLAGRVFDGSPASRTCAFRSIPTK